ncbi:MAG: hypothetical protein ACRDOH_28300 [Streptosporangiaceae bacterium]
MPVTELITESGLRRDTVYDHPHLIDTYKARDTAPAALTALVGERDDLLSQLTAVKAELSRERHGTSILRKLIAELSLELEGTARCDGQRHPAPDTQSAFLRSPSLCRRPEPVLITGSQKCSDLDTRSG